MCNLANPSLENGNAHARQCQFSFSRVASRGYGTVGQIGSPALRLSPRICFGCGWRALAAGCITGGLGHFNGNI